MPGYQYDFGGSRQLVSQADSATIQSARVPRSRFINRWNRKTAFDAGYIIPILVDEILPGDHMQYKITGYIRMGTPLFPNFDNQRIDVHMFFVPNRIIWTNWVRFMGEQPAGSTDTINFTVPQVVTQAGGENVGGLWDHFGLPVIGQVFGGSTITTNALPFRAYNLIYNTWYRDQNQPSNAVTVNLGDGPDARTSYINSSIGLLTRAKSHDYFTSALPWPQKFTAPTVPFTGLAPIIGLGKLNQSGIVGGGSFYESTGSLRSYGFSAGPIDATAANDRFHVEMTSNVTGYPMVFANLALATGLDVNTIRQAFMVQSLLERDARSGTRYNELILSHFDVVNPDFRLQRPEYFGGGQAPLQITPIAQTTPTGGAGLGALGGAGTSTGQFRGSYAATEHGFVIILLSVKTEISYQQGIHRMWKRSTRYDYYWPDLAYLGEQTVLQQEIYATGQAGDTLVWGYQERWQEYRTIQSDVTGVMRSTAAGTIDPWHMAQKFTAAPALNMAFLIDQPPMTRVLAAGASTNQQYLADINYERIAARPMPTYGTPYTMGRF